MRNGTLTTARLDVVHPDDQEAAERIVRDGWPELRRRYYGALEHKLAMEGQYAGAGARKAAANNRTDAARRALEDKKARFRRANTDATEDDLRPETDELRRVETSEAAADADFPTAGKVARDAKTIFNLMTLRLAQGDARGERFRLKKPTIRRGHPTDVIKDCLRESTAKVAEIERIRNAEEPISVLKEHIGRQVDDYLLTKDPFKVDTSGGEAKWRQPVKMTNGQQEIQGHYITVDDLLPLIVSLHRDEIRKKLFERVDRDFAGDTSLRMTKDEKKARLAKLRAELVDLQHEEAALRVILAGDAPAIAFRPEMDPMATLGLEVIR